MLIPGAALVAAVLAGCAGEPGGNKVGLTYDITPLPKNYKELVADYLKIYRKDRAVAKVGNAYQDSCRIGGNGMYYGWAVPVSYSAKRRGGTGGSQEIIWVNYNSVQMISSGETGHCVKA